MFLIWHDMCDEHGCTHTFGHVATTWFLTAQEHRFIIANSLLPVMPNRGKGGGKPADDEETPGPDRRLPREPLGPYNRPFPVYTVAHGIGECGQMIEGKARAKAKPHLPGSLRS